jgi:two-component system, chemotaxis family, chemotaxis protein CheY
MTQAERGVLVVDDDLDIRSVVDELLTYEGYQVKTAGNGRDALAILKGWRPRLIVLDLMMPIMDGWSFLAKQRLSRTLRHIPVIVMSASHTITAHEGHASVVDMVAKVSTHVKAADASERFVMVTP